MSHLTIQQVSASLDGALDGVSLELVVRHLGSCRDCRDRHARLSKQDDALRRMLAFEPTELSMSDAMARLDAVLAAEVRAETAPEVYPVLKLVPARVTTPAAPPPATPPLAVAASVTPIPPAARTPFRFPRHVALIGAALSALALLITAALLLPTVIHIKRPAVPQPRLPRLNVVQARPAAVPQDIATTPAPKRVVTAPIPVPAAPPAARATPVTPAAPVAPVAPMVAPVAPVVPETRSEPTSRATAPPIALPDNDHAAWPLLCGVVLDASGAAVAGARVSLADLDLAGRTDRRGHFCLAAPPGERTLTVAAQGFATARKLVSLEAQGLELQVLLADHE